MSKKNLMLGVIAGAAAGAIAGVLLAPDKGSVTRENLAKKSRDTMDNVKGQVNDFVDKVADNYLSGSEVSGKRTNERKGSESSERGRSTGSDFNSPDSPARSFS